ncbi:MAG: ATP-dependent metallopeptidase FtsH/Yme1/Tma family protein, partial [Pyrinomonadaceae bacterium]
MSSTVRQIIFWVLILAGAVLLYNAFSRSAGRNVKPLAYNLLVNEIQKGQINKLTIKQAEVASTDKSGQQYNTPIDSELRDDLMNLAIQRDANGTALVAEAQSEPASNGLFWSMLITWAPLLLFIGIWIFMLRQMQSGGNKALSFGKSRAKLLNNQQKRVTFKDVAGVDEAKEELQE